MSRSGLRERGMEPFKRQVIHLLCNSIHASCHIKTDDTADVTSLCLLKLPPPLLILLHLHVWTILQPPLHISPKRELKCQIRAIIVWDADSLWSIGWKRAQWDVCINLKACLGELCALFSSSAECHSLQRASNKTKHSVTGECARWDEMWSLEWIKWFRRQVSTAFGSLIGDLIGPDRETTYIFHDAVSQGD